MKDKIKQFRTWQHENLDPWTMQVGDQVLHLWVSIGVMNLLAWKIDVYLAALLTLLAWTIWEYCQGPTHGPTYDPYLDRLFQDTGIIVAMFWLLTG